MRWFRLSVALLFLGLGLLTVFKSPDWLSWKFSVVASQFGYLLAAVPLLVACLSLWSREGRSPFGLCVCAVSMLGALLLLQPCAQAWILARTLPEKLEAAFGTAPVARAPFTVGGLFQRWPRPAPKSTWTYSGTLQLDFYPAIGRRPAPCVIVIHGGGWNNGDRGQISSFNDWLAAKGYAVADISYRLAPGSIWPAQREDVDTSVAFVKQHALDWGVDPSRLVIFGRSAGGQIAEAAAYALHDPSVRGVVALYAPADMNFAWKWSSPDDALNSPELMREFLGGPPDAQRARYDSASAILLVDRETPPTLLVHGTIDTLVWNRQSVRLAARLSEARVPNLFVSLPWATHALELNPSSPSGQLTLYSVEWFLAATCR